VKGILVSFGVALASSVAVDGGAVDAATPAGVAPAEPLGDMSAPTAAEAVGPIATVGSGVAVVAPPQAAMTRLRAAPTTTS
jgi:hypothetical protein